MTSEHEIQSNGAQTARSEVSLLDLINVVLRHRWLVIGLPLLLFIAGGVISMFRDRTYTSTASFVPQSTDAIGSQLGGVAAQLGVQLSPGRPAESPAFYADLVRSREVLGAAVDSTYRRQQDGRTVNVSLPQLLELRGDSLMQRDRAIRYLQTAVGVSPARETGIIRVSASTMWPDVSQQLTERLVSMVNHFNIERRQSHAAAQRKFTEAQRSEAQRNVAEAEDKLQLFLQRNRDFRGSPQLSFEHDRLQREVDRRQQLYTSLSEAYEQARIDEVRNIAVITVIDQPSYPLRPDGRGTVVRAFTGLAIGLVIALAFAFITEYLRQSRTEAGADFNRFQSLKREAADDLLQPLESAKRLFRRQPR
jgi:uncharacterized protein involved in exopolysaccharide biosynthesis